MQSFKGTVDIMQSFKGTVDIMQSFKGTVDVISSDSPFIEITVTGLKDVFVNRICPFFQIKGHLKLQGQSL